MLLKTRHKNLDVWKAGVDFVSLIYRITASFPKDEMYALTNQLRRAAVSVPSNIAEGASRTSGAERKRFYSIARASLVEVDTQLEIALRLEYCTENDLLQIGEQLNHIFAMLSNLIQKTK